MPGGRSCCGASAIDPAHSTRPLLSGGDRGHDLMMALKHAQTRTRSEPACSVGRAAAEHRLHRPNARDVVAKRSCRECAATGSGLEHRAPPRSRDRSEEHTSELQSLMRNSYAVFCL